jgi:hypothetical protein
MAEFPNRLEAAFCVCRVWWPISTRLVRMPRHFIHYIPRRIVMRFPKERESPWFAGLPAPGEGFSRPMFHMSRRKTGPTRVVEPGDAIWIMSQIFSPWGSFLPPGLDARIDVEDIEEHNNHTRRFVSADTSSWFSLADVTGVLVKDKVISDPSMPIGHSLQSMRLLASPESLQAWSQKLATKRANFVSYRISDGTPSAFAKVKELLAQGEVVFWDRWCLPRRLAERREVVDDHALDEHLMIQLRQATAVWGVESADYSVEGSYSAREKAAAIRLGTYRPVEVAQGHDNRRRLIIRVAERLTEVPPGSTKITPPRKSAPSPAKRRGRPFA